MTALPEPAPEEPNDLPAANLDFLDPLGAMPAVGTLREQMLAELPEEDRILWAQMKADAYLDGMDETDRLLLDTEIENRWQTILDQIAEEEGLSEEEKELMKFMFDDPEIRAVMDMGHIIGIGGTMAGGS
ncbi:MAG: hypothetical protein M2R45_02766 [Verrucomicrobia subdivision 3 bacterium]|nr:hypothetical protein [Limisphaerales bacterium]MCS1414315.1 hypothetical protein [Limisphaerales bacterium]